MADQTTTTGPDGAAEAAAGSGASAAAQAAAKAAAKTAGGARAKAKAFFADRVEEDAPAFTLRKIHYGVVMLVFILCMGAAAAFTQEPQSLAVGAVGGVVLGLGLGYLAGELLPGRRPAPTADEKLKEHAKVVRDLQRGDVAEALARAARRCGLEGAEELGLARFGREESLFRGAGPEAQAFDGRALRLLSIAADDPAARLREIRWRAADAAGAGGAIERVEVAFNPMRLSALSLTADALVICETEIDSVRGEATQSVERVPYADIAGVTVRARRQEISGAPDPGAPHADYAAAEMAPAIDAPAPAQAKAPAAREDVVGAIEIRRRSGGAPWSATVKHPLAAAGKKTPLPACDPLEDALDAFAAKLIQKTRPG